MTPCERNFYIDELKVPNFRPFSLTNFRVMQGSNPLASKKILHLVISKCLIHANCLGKFYVSFLCAKNAYSSLNL